MTAPLALLRLQAHRCGHCGDALEPVPPLHPGQSDYCARCCAPVWTWCNCCGAKIRNDPRDNPSGICDDCKADDNNTI
jgi:hypothetical protein